MKKKKSKKFLELWILDQFWTKAFFISHISGWFIACLQTLWIVYEIRKKRS
jgi:hypothetical protein